MPDYILILKQYGEGCDYTIGCGMRFEHLKAKDDATAVRMAMSQWGRAALLDDDDSTRLSECSLFRVDAKFDLAKLGRRALSGMKAADRRELDDMDGEAASEVLGDAVYNMLLNPAPARPPPTEEQKRIRRERARQLKLEREAQRQRDIEAADARAREAAKEQERLEAERLETAMRNPRTQRYLAWQKWERQYLLEHSGLTMSALRAGLADGTIRAPVWDSSAGIFTS